RLLQAFQRQRVLVHQAVRFGEIRFRERLFLHPAPVALVAAFAVIPLGIGLALVARPAALLLRLCFLQRHFARARALAVARDHFLALAALLAAGFGVLLVFVLALVAVFAFLLFAVGARLRLLRLLLLGLRVRGTRRIRRPARQIRALVYLLIDDRRECRFFVELVRNPERVRDSRSRFEQAAQPRIQCRRLTAGNRERALDHGQCEIVVRQRLGWTQPVRDAGCIEACEKVRHALLHACI